LLPGVDEHVVVAEAALDRQDRAVVVALRCRLAVAPLRRRLLQRRAQPR